jgi:hypothetical protein
MASNVILMGEKSFYFHDFKTIKKTNQLNQLIRFKLHTEKFYHKIWIELAEAFFTYRATIIGV